jgi:acetyl-CoA C-acetyltransferase
MVLVTDLNPHGQIPLPGMTRYLREACKPKEIYPDSMRSVAVAGIGKTAFGAFPDQDLRSLTITAIGRCLADAGLTAAQVEAFYLGNFAGPEFMGQSHLAPYVAGAAGITGVPCTRFEAACASSGAALYHAYTAVAAGMVDAALVAGVEKMTHETTPRVTSILTEAGDVRGEGRAGATFPAVFAMIARRHMHQYGTTREHLAAVAVKNHASGFWNGLAHMRKQITIEQALHAKPICEPLGLYDCSLVSDGAAAVLLMPREKARDARTKPIRILGIAQASDHVALEEKVDITTFPANRIAAYKAFGMSGLAPKDIDLLELHDCFTIAEIIALEDLGFVSPGEGGPYTAAGHTALHGTKPVNTSGGLKSKGHPVGATGVGQICDLVVQMRGEAEPERQVTRREVGLAQNLGGSGATSVVTILGVA